MEAVALAQLGPDSSVKAIAQGIKALTGFTAEHYESSVLWEHLHPDDRERTALRWHEYLREPDGAKRNFRARLRRPDDSWCWVQISATLALEQPDLQCVVASIEPFGDGWDRDSAPREPMVALRSEPPERADFLQILLNLSADAVIILDDEFRIKWASSGARVASGWNADDFSQVAPADLVHPDDLELLANAIGRWRESPQDPPPVPVTVRLRHSELGWRWTDIVGRDLRTDPEIRGIALAMSDADDRVRANDQVAASERRHRKLVQRSHERILLTDQQGVITWASEASAESPERWRRQSMVGNELGSTLPSAHQNALRELRESCLGNPGSTCSAELLLPTSEGTRQWTEVTARNLLDDPDVLAVAWNFRDIHEQKVLFEELEAASEVFKSLAVSSSTGLFEEDAELGCVDVNPRWEEITGIRAADAMGEGWHRMIADNYLDTSHVPPTRPGPEVERRARIRRPDGKIRWIDARTTVARMPDGKLRRFGGIEDVTETVQAEQERQRLLEIFDLTSDMVMVVGADGNLIFLNRSGRVFHGISEERYAEVVGTTWPMTLPRSPQFVDMIRKGSAMGRWS
ncbi:MAG: PAS domain S-box protein, partial [Microthrixaceae bacterium]